MALTNTMKITDAAHLKLRIQQLESYKEDQEEEIKHLFRETLESLKPGALTDKLVHEIKTDTHLRQNLLKLGLGLSANYLIGKIMRRNSTFKRFVSSMILEKVASALISKNAGKLESWIRNINDHFTEAEKQEPLLR